jgi:hypothetical protein
MRGRTRKKHAPQGRALCVIEYGSTDCNRSDIFIPCNLRERQGHTRYCSFRWINVERINKTVNG